MLNDAKNLSDLSFSKANFYTLKTENTELKNALDACIMDLPEKYRMVFLLKTVQQYETEEICNELDITPSNLWVIIHRARLQLRTCMEKNWFKN